MSSINESSPFSEADSETLQRRIATLEAELAARREQQEAVEAQLTRLAQIDKALRKSETHLARAQQMAHMGSYEFDVPDGEVVWSQETYRLLGLDPAGPPPSPEQYLAMVAPEDREIVNQAIAAAIEQGQSFDIEYRLVTPQGVEKYLRSVGGPLRDEQEEVTGIVGTIMDITSQKEAEMALRQSEERWRSLVENAPLQVMIIAEDGRIQYVNRVHFSEQVEDLIGQSAYDLIPASEHDILRQAKKDVFQEGKTAAYEVSLSLPTGKTRIFQNHAAPLWREGEVVAALNLALDITESKKNEESLRESNRLLQETLAELDAMQAQMIKQERMAAVGHLAAGLAHEFNNIMAAILLYADLLLLRGDLSPEDQKRAAAIRERGQRAAQLTQQIQDFGRRTVMQREVIDLRRSLVDWVDLLQRTLPENVEIRLFQGSGTAVVDADPGRLQQVLTNLAVNARDAMPEGGELTMMLDRIEVGQEKRPLPDLPSGSWIRLAVTDTGCGIPADILPHIFEPFFTTRAPLGSGLGLAQVYGIIKQHDGYIDVHSKAGAGAAFNIYLPAHPTVAAVNDSSDAVAVGEGETVLIVEDDANLLRALARATKRLGYQVLTAANGIEALDQYEQASQVDLMLMDWVMPGMSGKELLRRLRQLEPAMPVIVITGYPLAGVKLKTLGVSEWMQKPVNLSKLGQILQRVLRQR